MKKCDYGIDKVCDELDCSGKCKYIKTNGKEGIFYIEKVERGINIFDEDGFVNWYFWEELICSNIVEAFGLENIGNDLNE